MTGFASRYRERRSQQMALAAGHAGHTSGEIGPMTFHARIDVLVARSGVFRIHPVGWVFPCIAIKWRLFIRCAAPGQGRNTNEKQKAEPPQHHYL